MTGPEHYIEAERKLLMAWEDGRTGEESLRLIAEAHVHATLAHAAATAMSGHSEPGMYASDFLAWNKVAGV